jgi:hypothetical protein
VHNSGVAQRQSSIFPDEDDGSIPSARSIPR